VGNYKNMNLKEKHIDIINEALVKYYDDMESNDFIENKERQQLLDDIVKTQTAFLNRDKIKAVMVEYIDDTNSWSWYAITTNDTPKKALTRYCEDFDEEYKIEEKEYTDYSGGEKVYYIDVIDVRAYYINI